MSDLTPEQIRQELRRSNLRPWARSRAVILFGAPAVVLVHAVHGVWTGLRDGVVNGVSEVREAWGAMR